MFNLLRLQCAVVVGADNVEFDVIVGISRNDEFPVEFGAPGVIAALRDADVPRRSRLGAGAARTYCCQQCQRMVEV